MKFVIISAFLLVSCNTSGLKKFTFQYFSMDTMVEVTLFAKSEKEADEAVQELKQEGKRIEELLSPFKEGSEVRKINDRPDRQRVVVGPETAELVRIALKYAEETGGLFDITIGTVKWLWGMGSDQTPRRPSDDEIREARTHVGWQKVHVSGDTLFFDDPEVRIDLGGIGGGHAGTRMKAILERRGIRSYLINDGGDIILGAPKPDGKEWTIAIQHPRKPDTAIRKEKLANTCIVTSGDYERFFMLDGKRYHHIFDPSTGYPATGLVSATVICDDPVRADVYSTSLFAAGGKWGLKQLPGIRKYIVYDDSLKETVSSPSQDPRENQSPQKALP